MFYLEFNPNCTEIFQWLLVCSATVSAYVYVFCSFARMFYPKREMLRLDSNIIAYANTFQKADVNICNILCYFVVIISFC